MLTTALLRPQNELDAPHDPSSTSATLSSHISNVGRMIEDMEGKMRSSLQDVYFSSESSHPLSSSASTSPSSSSKTLTDSPHRLRNQGYHYDSSLVGRICRGQHAPRAAGRARGTVEGEGSGSAGLSCLRATAVVLRVSRTFCFCPSKGLGWAASCCREACEASPR
jgi:hypothetical protein